MPKKLPCPIQEKCRLCPHVNASYENALEKKSKRDLKTLELSGLLSHARVMRTIASPRKLGFRTVFKLAVRKNPDRNLSGRFRLGLFNPGSHQIGPDLTGCPLHASSLRALLKSLYPLLESSGIEPYDEVSHQGDLRYLIGRTNQAGDQILLTWVVTRPLESQIQQMVSELKNRGVPVCVTAMNIHQHVGNAIWGKETKILGDKSYIEEELSGNILALGPTSFFQVNPWQADNIYSRIARIAQELNKKKVAWDVFSGVGPISVFLARKFERVLAFEESPEAVQLAHMNAERNTLKSKIDIVGGLAEETVGQIPNWASRPDVIVVNPSRRGIHEKARKHLIEVIRKNPEVELVYLSCSIESLVRDLSDFKSYSIRLHELQGFDMHAQSEQMEWLGRLKLMTL